jgi:acyl transferase domain-containing protein
MGRSLYHSSSLFRRHVDECHSFLTSNGFPGVLPIILASTSEYRLTAEEEFEAFQAATFSVQYGLMRLWKSWGLSPFAVVGHRLVGLF